MNRPATTKPDFWPRASYQLAWLALIVALLFVLAAYGPGRTHHAILHNADAVFIPIVFQDAMARGSVAGWDLPTNPYFFPDMLLFVPLLALVPKVQLAIILYGGVQLILLVVGMMQLQRFFFARDDVAETFLLLTLTVCLLFIATGEQPFYAFMLVSVHHTGALLVFPFATLLTLRLLSHAPAAPHQTRISVLLFALVVLTSLSDSLFILQFVIPALLALLVWGRYAHIAWTRLLMVSGLLLLAAVAGQWLRQFVVSVEKLLIYTNRGEENAASASWTNFVGWLNDLAINEPAFVLFWLLSVGALIGVLVITLRARDATTRLLPLLATLVLLSALTSVVAVVMSGNFQDHFSARYVLSTLYLPLLTGLPLLLALLFSTFAHAMPRRATAVVTSGLATVALVMAMIVAVTRGDALFSAQPVNLASFTDYQEPLLSCLLRETEQRGLRYGLAGYWQSEMITAFSDGALYVAPIGRNLSPTRWNNNSARYQAPFEFVILDGDAADAWRIRKTYVRQRFGQPASTFMCENSEIFVYNRPTDVPIRYWSANQPALAQLDAVGDAATFFGYALPTANEAVAIGLSQGASEQWENPGGTLAYANLASLPAGSYALALDLYADSVNTGAWEVVEMGAEEDILVAAAPITAAGVVTASGHFTLAQASDVEIRVKYNGNGTLFVDKLRVARVDPAMAAHFQFAAPSVSSAPAQGEVRLLYPDLDAEQNIGNVDFAWQWTGQPLPPHQTFEVRLWRAGESIHYGAHDAAASRALIRQIGDTYILRLDLNGAYSVMQHGTGDYEWTVGIVTVDPTYQDLGIEAAPRLMRVLP